MLNEPDKPPESKSYMWARKTGDPACPIILFDFTDSLSAALVEQPLPDYQGILQTDSYPLSGLLSLWKPERYPPSWLLSPLAPQIYGRSKTPDQEA